MNSVAVSVGVMIAAAVVALAGLVLSLMRSRRRRPAATGPDMPTDYGLVLAMIGLAGVISALGVVVFLLLTT